MRDIYREHQARKAAERGGADHERPAPEGFRWEIDRDDPWACGGLDFTPLDVRRTPPVPKLRRIGPTHPTPTAARSTHYNPFSGRFEATS